jgi:hypothetical protein
VGLKKFFFVRNLRNIRFTVSHAVPLMNQEKLSPSVNLFPNLNYSRGFSLNSVEDPRLVIHIRGGSDCLLCQVASVLYATRQIDMSGKTYHVRVTNVEGLMPRVYHFWLAHQVLPRIRTHVLLIRSKAIDKRAGELVEIV